MGKDNARATVADVVEQRMSALDEIIDKRMTVQYSVSEDISSAQQTVPTPKVCFDAHVIEKEDHHERNQHYYRIGGSTAGGVGTSSTYFSRLSYYYNFNFFKNSNIDKAWLRKNYQNRSSRNIVFLRKY